MSPRLEEIQKDLLAKVLQVADLRMENLRRRIAEEVPVEKPAAPAAAACAGGIELVTIGCSTGGPPALQQVFQNLPLLPLPLVVAQHMPPTFTRLFAERVNKLTPYNVKEAVDGEPLAVGSVYVAPGGMQTEVRRRGDGGLSLTVFRAEANDLYAPSVDRLFRSASDCCAKNLIAVIMTGMGDDGSRGMKVVRERGGRTIAESEKTAIIFGMPGEAIKLGAVDEVLPLPEIPEAIRRLCLGS